MTISVGLNQAAFPGLATARFVEMAAAAGAEAVDLRPLDPTERPGHIAAAVRTCGLSVSGINALMDWALPDDPDPGPALDILLEIAVAVRAPLIVCVAPLRVGELPPHAEILRSAAERLHALAEVAGAVGVKLALEQVGRSSTRLDVRSGLRRLSDALAVAAAAGDDIVLVADSYNLATASEDLAMVSTIPLPRLGIAHLADRDAIAARRVFPGVGDLDLDSFVRALLESGYNGALTLEYFPSSPWPDPLAFAYEAMTTMRRYVHNATGQRDKTI